MEKKVWNEVLKDWVESKPEVESKPVENSNMLLEDSIYKILWDVFKYGCNYGKNYRNNIEDINQNLRKESENIINHIRIIEK